MDTPKTQKTNKKHPFSLKGGWCGPGADSQQAQLCLPFYGVTFSKAALQKLHGSFIPKCALLLGGGEYLYLLPFWVPCFPSDELTF